MKLKKLFRLHIIFGIVLLSSACAKNPVTGKRDFVLISESREIAMGREYDPQIVQSYGLYEHDKIQAFIDEKGQEMAAISHRSNLEYEFKILDSPILNAFAVPGGYVYFTRGIMAHFNNEAEFAGVLGHEIGHITARHSVRQQSKGILAQVGILAGLIAKPELAQFLDPASQALGILFLKYGRDAERESDELGVIYSTQVGYDAREMAGFFRTLERQQVSSGASPLPDFLSSHPSPADRNKRVGQLAQEWQQKEGLQDPKVNRESYLKMIEGMVYGEDPRQGFLEDRVFYHPDLRFRFDTPSGWNYQNTPSQVQLAPKEGNAVMLLTLASGESTQGAANKAVEQFQLVETQIENKKINGLDATIVEGVQKQESNQIRVRLAIISHGGKLYSLLGAAGQQDFGGYRTAIEQSINSFADLKDQEKLDRKPLRIALERTNKAISLREFLTANGVKPEDMDRMGILNGMDLDQEIPSGTLIKLTK
ncbi:M48 family metalloprotease [Litoribacter ruber]|uniref:M48 family metalloprotease n=1 Tax=Litoribacter ruber TaxID=702568 RepID=A0AAP2G2A0_9BACT|nr:MULTISPECIES: M48 family metalloprotease [Litoribacter]MBS9525457.1 M48 family metalloprotease [Litoribacter alkaliphilus]MBT0813089.1 M48 family metalloprotease [Litoribacter ruber]